LTSEPSFDILPERPIHVGAKFPVFWARDAMNREIAGTAPQGIARRKADLPGNFRGACPALRKQRAIGRARKICTALIACVSINRPE